MFPGYDLFEWDYIPGYENYMISIHGEIYSLKKKKFRKVNFSRYYRVSLYDNENKQTSKLIHRLLAITFIFNPNPDKYKIVDHIDGNTKNNSLNNLQWCNQSMNIKKSKLRNTNKSGIKHLSYRKDTNKWQIVVHYGSYDTKEEAIEKLKEFSLF